MSENIVLIAEDDRMTRRILQHAFESHPALAGRQLKIMMAEDGQKALELFLEHGAALVLLDLFMPRLDGFGLCQCIREAPAGSFTPIIVTSGIWKQPEILETLRRDFSVEFIAKPFNVEELAALVDKVLPIDLP
ncbi:MAG: response regulator [bacterium]